jgi:hypothetical protein
MKKFIASFGNAFTGFLFFGIFLFTGNILSAQTNYSQSTGTVSLTGQTYSSSTQDLSAVKVTGGTLTLTNSTISSTGNTSSNDNSSFYGLNAVLLATTSSGTAVITSSGNTITSTGSGANGIFAYEKASITTRNDKLTMTGGGGHAIMCSGGGTITVENDTAVTSGGSSSNIATDRGSGTITVNGGTYISNGSNSAAIYSTGIITCTNATLTATGAEALVIEGSNKIILNNCTVKGSYNKWGAMLYQSMSGDAEGVDGYLTMTGGSFTYTGTKGGMFYNTNSTAYITLNGVTLSNSCDTLVRCIKGSWGGSTASSGGITNLTTENQVMSGLIHVDANSKASITLNSGSVYTGAINASNTGKVVNLTMDASSSWIVTADSYLDTISNSAGISGTSCTNITGNGHKVYYDSSLGGNSYLGSKTYSLVNGGYLLPLGATVSNALILTTGLTLDQNYPNPVKTSTTFSYSIPSQSKVTLTVYNYFGQPVAVIVNEEEEEGTHEVSWTPQLSNGCYIYVLNCNGTISSKRLVISK